jgi:hypothetical protein
VKNNDGFVLPIVLLLSLLVSVLLAGALALAALRGKLAASASGRLKETSAAEGAVWLGLSLAARDLLVDPLADSGPNLAGPLPTSISTDAPPADLPPGSRQVASPLLPAGTELWLASRPPGRILATARNTRGGRGVERTGHLEYLETTPFSYGLIINTPGEEVLPAIAVTGRIAVIRQDGGTTRFTRLDLGGPPPPADPGVGWTISAPPGELVVAQGGIEILAGTPPAGRAVAIGGSLPDRPLRFPEGVPPPVRTLIVRQQGAFPAVPLLNHPSEGTTILERCRASGLILGDPPPWDDSTPGGRLLFEEERIEIGGIVVIDGDVEFPAGTTYSGTGILAVTGNALFRGDLLPCRGFPTEDALAILVGGEASLHPDDFDGGTLHAILSAGTLAVNGEWTLFGLAVTGAIDGPADASLTICPPPRWLLPFAGTPLGSSPTWLLLEAGCRDPNVRW